MRAAVETAARGDSGSVVQCPPGAGAGAVATVVHRRLAHASGDGVDLHLRQLACEAAAEEAGGGLGVLSRLLRLFVLHDDSLLLRLMRAVRTGRPCDGVASRHRTRADLSRRACKGVVTGCIESLRHGQRLAPRSGAGVQAALRHAMAFRVRRASGAGGKPGLETGGWARRRSARSSHPIPGVADAGGAALAGTRRGIRWSRVVRAGAACARVRAAPDVRGADTG